MPEFLYQMEETGNRERQYRDRESVCVCETEHSWKRGIASAIKKTVRENICDRHVILISTTVKMLLMRLFPQFAFFSV